MGQLEKPEAEKECDCMKKWNRTINLIMILSVVATIVRFLVDYVDLLILRPEEYAVRSAPWYLGGLLSGAITLVVLLACIVTKVFIKHRQKIK